MLKFMKLTMLLIFAMLCLWKWWGVLPYFECIQGAASVKRSNKQLGEEYLHSQVCHQKFLLLTTQRSGSTWTCDLLNAQDGITCGGPGKGKGKQTSEMLIELSFQDHNLLTWSEMNSKLNMAFDQTCEQYPSTAVGYKIMYDQIPSKFRYREFEKYLQDNNIAIVHLVREAKVLRQASQHDVSAVKAASGKVVHHAYDSSEVNNLPKINKMQWKQAQVKKFLQLEEESDEWNKQIHFLPFVRDYYLSYENMLSREGLEDSIRQLISFLGLPMCGYSVNTKAHLQQLHSPLCGERVEDYEELMSELNGTKTAAACRMLDAMLGSKN